MENEDKGDVDNDNSNSNYYFLTIINNKITIIIIYKILL